MPEEIEISDVFSKTDIETLKDLLDSINKKFNTHDHDGRNTPLIDSTGNSRKIRLLSIGPISDKSDGNVTLVGGSQTLSTTLTSRGDKMIAASTGSTNHGLLSGDSVTIAGCNTSQCNGTFTVYVTSLTAFYYFVPAEQGGSLTGTITAAVPRTATVLTRDMFYNHLAVINNSILITNGFRVFGDIVEIQNGGYIVNNGYDGGAGGGVYLNDLNPGVAGALGGQAPSGSLVAGSVGLIGVVGGAAGNGGSNGNNGGNAAKSLGAAGSGGGNGGDSGSDTGAPGSGGNKTGGTGGSGGSQTGTVYNVPRSQQSAYLLADTQPSNTFALLTISAGGGSGGSGAGGTSGSGNVGGGSGGSAGSGGIVCIFGRQIINSGIVQAKGGHGGNGGYGWTATGASNVGGGGGGGGGAGGAGGVIILVYGDLSGSGTLVVSGGSKGTGGAGGSGNYVVSNHVYDGKDGVAGSDGADGAAGNTFSIKVSSL